MFSRLIMPTCSGHSELLPSQATLPTKPNSTDREAL